MTTVENSEKNVQVERHPTIVTSLHVTHDNYGRETRSGIRRKQVIFSVLSVN